MTEPFALTQCKTISSEEFERLDKSSWILEPKVDGWRMQMYVEPDGVLAWTRTQHDASGKMPRVEEQLKTAARVLQTPFRVDGEAVYIDDEGYPDYNFTARCLGSGTEVCIDKQMAIGHLTFVVFDILAIGTEDLRALPLAKRKKELQRTIPELSHLKPIMGYEPSFERHTKNFEQYKEGSVLKHLGSPYAGKRHKSWLKWKEIETIDVKIIGYKEGQGKYMGLIGAIQFIAPDGTVGFCSGMTDDERIYVSDHRQELIGRTIEIKHFGKLVDGYRHPQYKRLRPDKQW